MRGQALLGACMSQHTGLAPLVTSGKLLKGWQPRATQLVHFYLTLHPSLFPPHPQGLPCCVQDTSLCASEMGW